MTKKTINKSSLYDTKHFPVFSIITITLNNYKSLKKTSKSIENQTFKDYEWIVIDGQSHDETLEFLRQQRTKTRTHQNPFRFISEKDDGLYDAMNKGIEIAKGHYLLFLNAGDRLASTTTLQTLANACKNKPDFIYGGAYEETKISAKPAAKPAKPHTKIAWGMFTHHQAMLYRRHLVRDSRLRYSLRYKIASDYDFTARFLSKTDKIKHIAKPVCIFEAGGISQKNAWIGRKEQYIIREILEIVNPAQNLGILFTQTIAWELKTLFPRLYYLIKTAEKQLTRSN
ncbi:MAG: glycosyltransferase family 2 protein [Alphaproteobacteria bacterium]